MIVAFVAVLALENFWYLPGARKVAPRLDAVEEAGLAQGWGMFVFHPDPPRSAQVLTSRLTYADGAVVDRPLPQGARFLGAQRAARWSKYGEFARPVSHGERGGAGSELWAPLARWLVRTESRPGNAVVRVELVARDRVIPPLGSGADPPWTETVVFTAP